MLTVLRQPATEAGVFRILENRGSPTFVTERGRAQLEELGLRGVGFYKAGTVID
jgi:hypothetical protein